jgi:hypothetical protein
LKDSGSNASSAKLIFSPFMPLSLSFLLDLLGFIISDGFKSCALVSFFFSDINTGSLVSSRAVAIRVATASPRAQQYRSRFACSTICSLSYTPTATSSISQVILDVIAAEPTGAVAHSYRRYSHGLDTGGPACGGSANGALGGDRVADGGDKEWLDER